MDTKRIFDGPVHQIPKTGIWYTVLVPLCYSEQTFHFTVILLFIQHNNDLIIAFQFIQQTKQE